MSKTILVVEDYAPAALVIKMIIEELGHQCEVAGTAGEALHARTRDPDLILMDINLPDMDGLTATRKLRAWERENARESVPVVGLSSDMTAQDEIECKDAGMTGAHYKAATFAKLESIVTTYL